MTDLNKEQIDKEVLPFLAPDARTDLKIVALEHFLGLTGTDEGRKFVGGNKKYLSAITTLKNDTQAPIAKDAYLALINLSTDNVIAHELLILDSHPTLVKDLLLYILKSDSVHADAACMILSNLSRPDGCASIIVKTMIENSAEIGIDKIIQVFCLEKHNTCNQKLHYIGPFLSNITQVKETRKYILDKERCVIQRLVPFTQYKDSKIRRGGIVGTLRNCCFEIDCHEWLLSDSVDILPRLLLPLAGPEEFDEEEMDKLPEDLQYLDPDKQREEDPDIRKMLVEAVTKLCTLQVCRQRIKELNTYVIMRELHKWEKDPAARFAIENLVSMLISDEPAPGMENMNEVDIPEDVHKELDKSHKELLEQIKQDTDTLEKEEQS